MPRRILITGCSGGGKSTLLAELARRGHATVPEPGRRIVAAETDPASPRLPWNDAACFARAALILARADHETAQDPGPVFFDRGLVDAALALAHATGTAPDTALLARLRYDPLVVLVPPWPQIHTQDAARRHDLAAAIAEYDRIRAALPGLGYRPFLLPRVPVAQRAEIVLAQLGRG